ncbi:MAG TPA: hypothetical protein VLE97_07205 [Gaiellaceae bacterium]|nr:hypothetical protein [Gaiellaceae bacterium]
MTPEPIVDLFVELAKLKVGAAYTRLQRAVLASLAEKIPTVLLDDVRIATTDELARRGVHVITRRPNKRVA